MFINPNLYSPTKPQRIISLVPSITELLYNLDLGERVVGITKFCIHPKEWFQNKQRVGGTKKINIDIIHSLKPDLIIANKEENSKEDVELLSAHFPIWLTDVKNYESALKMIKNIGKITDKNKLSEKIIKEIIQEKEQFNKVKKGNCIYLIWKNPYMTIGGDTYINDMLSQAGFNNIYKEENRYPIIKNEELYTTNIDYILLSSEPFPFKFKDVEEIQELTQAKVLLVDGEMFSWYGSKMKKVWRYFDEINNNELL